MSKISTVYDAVLSNHATLFPTKTRIPNPYDLTQNAKQFLSDGYGVKVGIGTPQILEFDSLVMSRDLTVVLSREVFAHDSDTDIKDDATKLILEDIYQIQNLFYSYSELGIEAEILKIDLAGTSEIRTVNVEKHNSLSMEVTFSIWVRENL